MANTQRTRDLTQELAFAERSLAALVFEQENVARTLDQAKILLAEYKARKNSDGSIEKLREDVEKLKKEAEAEAQKTPRLVPLTSAFNGIIEFNNITSISTSLGLDGQGNATITMENPMNILRISQEDIMLALSEDPYLEQSLTGDPTDGTPNVLATSWSRETGQIGDVNSPFYASAEDEFNTGNLVFYRGQYYDPIGLEKALRNGGGVIDAKTGISISEPATYLNQYRNTQRAVFEEISNRYSALPEAARQIISSSVDLPTIPTQITAAYLEANKEGISALFNQNAAAPQASGGQSGTTQEGVSDGQKIVEGYQKTLQKYEDQLGQNFDFKRTKKTRIRSDPNDPSSPETEVVSQNKRQNIQLFPSLSKVTALKDPQVQKRFYRDLEKYFNGKWVVEVADRIWIWMSSPSRTIQVSGEGFGLVETAVGRAAAELANQAEYLSLRKKLTETQKEIEAKELEIESLTAQRADVESIVPFDENQDKALGTAIDKVEEEKEQLIKLRDEQLEGLEKIENEIDPTRKTSQQGVDGQNVSASERGPKEEDFSKITAGSTIGQIPLSGVLFSTYGGMEENQYQVFEGVVTQVTGTFNGETYTLQVSCRDISYYLEQTRVLEKPSLNNFDVIALLNDPIYRYLTDTVKETFCGGRFKNAPTDPKDPSGHPLAGRWKSGAFVTSALISPQNNRVAAEQQIGLSEAELTCLHGLTPYSKLYANLDSANLISLLVTGLPFDADLYLKMLNGTSSLTRLANGEVHPREDSPFEVARALTGAQNRHLGDFVPFLELSRNYTKRTLERLEKQIEALEQRVRDLMDRRPERTPKAVSTPEYTNFLIDKARTGATLSEAVIARALKLNTATAAAAQPNDGKNISGLTYMRTVLKGLLSNLGIPNNKQAGLNFSNIGGRISILSGLEERVWLEHFKTIAPAEQAGIPKRVTELQTEYEKSKEAVAAAQRANSPDLAALQQQNAALKTELDRAKIALGISGTSTVSPSNCVKVDAMEAKALYKLAKAQDDYNKFLTNYNRFVLFSTAKKPGEVQIADDQPGKTTGVDNALALGLRQFNKSEIYPSKRKIIEGRKKNFLLIHDEYLVNERLQPYKLDVSNANVSEPWRSQFTTPLKICKEVAELIDYEFYADEAGHLRFKPPFYNKLLKEHFDIEAFRPEIRYQLRELYPDLEALERLSYARLTAQGIEDASYTALLASRLQLSVGNLDQSELRTGSVVTDPTLREASTALGAQAKRLNVVDARNAQSAADAAVLQVDVTTENEEGFSGSNPSSIALNTEQSGFRDALDSLYLDSPVSDYQDAYTSLVDYLKAYELKLTELNRQISDLINAQVSQAQAEGSDEFESKWTKWYATVRSCYGIKKLSITMPGLRQCVYDEKGVPIADESGRVIESPFGNDPHPKYLLDFGADVPSIYDRFPETSTIKDKTVGGPWDQNSRTILKQYLDRATAFKLKQAKNDPNYVPSQQEIIANYDLYDPFTYTFLSIPIKGKDPENPNVEVTKSVSFSEFVASMGTDVSTLSDHLFNSTYQLNLEIALAAYRSNLEKNARDKAFADLGSKDLTCNLDDENATVESKLKSLDKKIAEARKAGDEALANQLTAEATRCRRVAYQTAIRQRYLMLVAHRNFLDKMFKDYFTSPRFGNFYGSEDSLTAQSKAILNGQDQVGLLSALEVLAIEATTEVPFFVDEFNIHRLNAQIIYSETFTEKRPDFVRVDVTGLQNFTDFSNIAGGLLYWAGGVDYDLWRTYGWSEQSMERAFLNTRELVREYCTMMLTRQRSRILSGSVTVRGDSKYKIGDCVYHEESNLYFYVTNVSHSFSYGSDYTTTLTLEYSRRPTEFISHPFDVLGQLELNADSSEIARTYGFETEVAAAPDLHARATEDEERQRRVAQSVTRIGE